MFSLPNSEPMIETLKGGKYEKSNLTETVNMKKVTLLKQGSVSVK